MRAIFWSGSSSGTLGNLAFRRGRNRSMGFAFSVLLAAVTTLSPVIHATTWLGKAPEPGVFAGRVVVVDVFTFDCINCKHVVPELRKLQEAFSRRDVLVVGIHSPETPYERDREAVIRNLAAQGITWPVALDNSFSLWNAYGIQYWPSQLIFDRKGVLRQTVIGEGKDNLIDSTVRRLIRE